MVGTVDADGTIATLQAGTVSEAATVGSLSSQVATLAGQLLPRVWQTPTRALDTDFVVSATRDALVVYTVQLGASLSLSGTSSASVTLNVAGAAHAAVSNALTLALGLLSLTQSTTQQFVLTSIVPANDTVHLTSALAGGGTASLINVMEVLL